MTPWHERPYVVLDLETTGVDRENDRIVTATVGILPATSFDGDPRFGPNIREWLADPGIEIPQEASDIHGITTEYAREFGLPADRVVAEVASELESLLTDTPEVSPLVIYNAPFDITMLDRECRRHGIKPLHDRLHGLSLGTHPLHVIDPLVIDKAVNKYVRGKGQRKLTPTCARYGIELTDAHNATADALATGRLARVLHVPQKGDDDRTAANRAALAGASLEQLQEWQKSWRHRDQLSLADWFRRQAGGAPTTEEAEKMRAASADITREAPFWPYIPVGAFADNAA